MKMANITLQCDVDFPHFSGHASLTAVEVNDAGHEHGEEDPKVFG
ncbi:hypothetical protein GCM10007160_42920 [Litchfieldella qijiaojingensis]|uniref:Uncharacterized protein n=1 Tax=Litchfieldella qijiaojingensis TaxID=980347 RepID=A0ABQ2ZEK0_9GAMM|nr:hypothetical protein GCM10007160_42920 [Halomonas qijiaojingensis]